MGTSRKFGSSHNENFYEEKIFSSEENWMTPQITNDRESLGFNVSGEHLSLRHTRNEGPYMKVLTGYRYISKITTSFQIKNPWTWVFHANVTLQYVMEILNLN